MTADKAGVWCFRAVYTPTGNTYTARATRRTASASRSTRHRRRRSPRRRRQRRRAVGRGRPLATGRRQGRGDRRGGRRHPDGHGHFFICDPSEVRGAATARRPCATGGDAVGNPRTSRATRPVDPPTSQDLDRGGHGGPRRDVVLPRGVLSERVERGNYLGSSDASHTECFSSRTRRRPVPRRTGCRTTRRPSRRTGGTPLNGTLSFTLYSGDNCGATSGAVLRAAEAFTIAGGTTATRSTTNGTSNTVRVDFDRDRVVEGRVRRTQRPLVADSTHCEKTSLTIDNNND